MTSQLTDSQCNGEKRGGGAPYLFGAAQASFARLGARTMAWCVVESLYRAFEYSREVLLDTVEVASGPPRPDRIWGSSGDVPEGRRISINVVDFAASSS